MDPVFSRMLESISTQVIAMHAGAGAEAARCRSATPRLLEPPRVVGLELHEKAFEELWVYKPWTGLLLELLSCNSSEDSLDDVDICDGTRPHQKKQCFQAFVTDVHVEVVRTTNHTNHVQLVYTPVYAVWVPAQGSLFDIPGRSLPAPVNEAPGSPWSFDELYEMEEFALGTAARKSGTQGKNWTFVPVLQKSCCMRTPRLDEYLDLRQKYPPLSLQTSSALPIDWQRVVALPPACSTPCINSTEGARHVCKLAEVPHFAFDPVLFEDTVEEIDGAASPTPSRFATPRAEYESAYRGARDKFLATMRPLYETVTAGGDPSAHGWKLTRGGRTRTWERAKRGLKRREQSPGR